MSALQLKYIQLLSSGLLRFHRKGEQSFCFRCPVCGDSKKNPYKTRAYLFQDKNEFFFKCHNCGASSGFDWFLRERDFSLFQQYRMEKFGSSYANVVQKSPVLHIERQETWRKLVVPAQDEPTALAYLKDRMIPEEKYSDVYYIDDLNLLKTEFSNYEERDFVKDQRLLLPIFSVHNQMIGMNCRAINKSSLRYVLLKKETEEPLIYNLNKVNRSEKIYVFEGAFDSMFIPNSIAVNGCDFLKVSEIIDRNRDVLVYDNTPRNLELLKAMERRIEEEWRICIWPADVVWKDVNDMVTRGGMSPLAIKHTIDSHTYCGLIAKLEFSKWKKR